MTVIAVWADGREALLAADTLGVGGPGVLDTQAWPGLGKLTRLQLRGYGTAVVGIVGAMSLMHVATRWAGPPRPRADLDGWALEWAARLTDEAIRRHIVEDDDEHGVAGSWLVAFRGRAWALHHHNAIPVEFAAVGSGGAVALGAMHALRPQVAAGALTRQEALERSVSIACEAIIDCGLPVQVERA